MFLIHKHLKNKAGNMKKEKKCGCLFIILGATGDLTKRKLIPAIYKLIENKKIDKLAIIGLANSKSGTIE